MLARMRKTYLLTPGPTQVPDRVLALSARQIIHHRTPQFTAIMEEVNAGLKYLFQTKQDVLLLASSGTVAMDAAVTNLFKTGDKVIAINGGKFGERWSKIATAYGLQTVELKLEPGTAATVKQVEALLVANPDARGVLFQASETSTGTRMPTREICALTKSRKDCISVVDAITALGVFDLPMDDWGIDVLITGSQKALMLPPGLACLALSDKAWGLAANANIPKFYFDLSKEKKAIAKGQTTWTPPISLIIGLQETLKMIREEGLHNVFKRHDLLARATRNAVKALGLEVLSKDPSNAVTAVRVPAEIKDGKLIPKTMRDKYGVSIAGGQDELEGKIFRLTHLGYIDRFDVLIGIGALELTLQDLGYSKFQFGTGTGAVLQTYKLT
ncbi:MAG: alanine--glyoxylate aminotransferase family protein [Deltaproteobacteria bacterium]|nr:alanine--glyoxylate aminotransferase family protein [Deltaproteobacteria bacterium]